MPESICRCGRRLVPGVILDYVFVPIDLGQREVGEYRNLALYYAADPGDGAFLLHRGTPCHDLLTEQGDLYRAGCCECAVPVG